MSYAALGVTGFRGFNQFAFLGGLGMTLVWLATYVFMAPLLVLFERLRPLAKAAPARHAGAATPRGGPVARRVAAVVERFAGPIALTGLAATVAGGVLVARFAQDPIEYDFTKLGSRQGAIDGGTYWGKRLDIVMQSYLTPTVILTDTDASAAQVERALTAEKEAEGPDGPIDRVITLATVLPDDQARKIEVLRRIKGRLTDRWVKRIPEANRAAVDELRRTTKLTPVSVDDLPDHIGRLFKEKDGRTGRLVLVYPKVSVGSSHGRRQIDFVRGVRRSALKTDPAAQVAGSLILSADIIESITKDGFLATSLSFTAVTWLTLLILRSARSAAWVVGSLSMGTLWMGGALGLFGIKLNFVNFAVLPITFGIGIDYAVNLYERYRQTGPGGAPEALATSGGAIALCSLTTIIGYSALLVADNRAIFSFGLTAVLGEVTCLSAALLALPALLIVRDRRAARRDRS